MDVVTAEIYFPRLSKPENKTNFKDFLQGKSTDYLLNSSHATSKSVLHDILILQFKAISSGVRRCDLDNFKVLVESIGGLLLYIGLHLNTLKARGCNIPPQLSAICQLNDPKRHAHGIKQLNWEIMKNLVSALSLELEKSYVSRKGFLPIKNILDELLGSTAKYLDYMEENRASAQMSQAGESEPDYSVEMHELPLAKDLSKYSE